MSHPTTAVAARGSDFSDVETPGQPPIAAAVFLLLGGIAAALQLVVPWVSNTKESSTGWGQYFGQAHQGAGEIIAAYAIPATAIAGIVMIVAGVGLFSRRPSYSTQLTLGTVATVVALVGALWWLTIGPTPSAHLFTLGWYLFLAAGVFGLLGLVQAMTQFTLAGALVVLGGLGAAVQIVLPWFSSSKRAVSGWSQYYDTAHKTTADLLAAYAIIVAAIAGLVVLLVGLGIGFTGAVDASSDRSKTLRLIGTVAALVLVICSAWWLGFAETRGTPSFGYFLLYLSTALVVAGLLIASGRHKISGIVLTLAGMAATAQVALPWFDKETGFGYYYRTSHDGFTEVIAAYAVLVSLVAGAAILLAGITILLNPARERTAALAARYAAIAMFVCIAWWLLLGPHPLAAALASGSFGWYLFIIAALAAFMGAGIPLASENLSFDKASFMVVFLGVPLAIFLVFVVSPFVQAIYYSMTDWKGFSPDMNFIGLDNYVKLFHDDKFRTALFNNIKLGIVVPLVTLILALAVASMVTVGGPSRGPVRGLKASSFYRVVSFFPYTVPAIVIGLIWAQVYDPARGILNKLLTSIGLETFTNFAWLGKPSTAMAASMFVIIWSFVGFYAVLFIASIKGISAEVYEAAKLDGASRFRTAISITIPLIRDTIQTAYIYIGIAALDAFVYMMALNPFGGPDNTTLVMSQDLYNTAFRKGQFGYATSMGVILAIVTLLFATLVFAVNRLTTGNDTPKSNRKQRRQSKTIAVAAHPLSTSQAG